jgi:hypothetical protein
VVTIGTADNGKVLCLRQGTAIQVILRGSLARKWTPIKVSSAALTTRPNRLALPVGATGASFMAAGTGTAIISSARPACATATSPTPVPGGVMHCGALQAFHVTIVVSG